MTTKKARATIRKPVILLPLLLLFLFSVWNVPAFAAEQATVNLPVSATGADCTAAIYDADGNELQTISIGAGETKFFALTCTGLDTLTYTVKLKDQDNDAATYDKTVYLLSVGLYMTANGEITYSVEAYARGASGGKVEKLIFKNERHSSPDPTPKSCADDPPVEKRIIGSPASSSVFTFTLKPKNAANPMPEGSVNGGKEISITGAGTSEFGEITFTEAGIYEYTVTERNGGIAGYTYDTAVYTVRYEITDQNGQLVPKRISLKDGKAAAEQAVMVFINAYKPPAPGRPGDTPSTGDTTNLSLWITLSGLSFSGLSFLMATLLRERKSEKKQS